MPEGPFPKRQTKTCLNCHVQHLSRSVVSSYTAAMPSV